MPLSESTTKLTEGGKIVLPAEYRKALNLNVGDELVMFLEAGEIRVVPRAEALRRAQELVSRYAGSRSLADELIEERKVEANRE